MEQIKSKFKIGEAKLELVNTELSEKIKKHLTSFEMAVKELNLDNAIKIRNNLGNLFVKNKD